MNGQLARWLLTGLFATLTMDVGSALVRRTGLTAGVPPQLLGRWFATLGRGDFRGRSILEAPSLRAELPLALVAHYLIGIGLTLSFLLLLRALRLEAGPVAQVAWALGFGLVTNLLPWLIMFPSMGFGAFGRAAPAALLLFRTSFVNHVFFGAGLAIFSLWLGADPPK